jgi:hypothetical protein
MQMKQTARGLTGLTAVVALAVMYPAMVSAQAPTFNAGGVGNYALLNGSNLALYIDRYGDLGAPQTTQTVSKPGGVLNGSGQPYVNADGSVQTPIPVSPFSDVTYAALYNPQATSGTLQQQVQAKTEYITLGNRSAVEGWSISVNHGTSFIPYDGAGMSVSNIVTTYNSSTGLLTATTNSAYTVGATNLGISEEVLFNDASRKNLAEFVTTFTNNGSSAIANLEYARVVDPNQGVAPPGNTGDTGTNQGFGTLTNASLFAIMSSDEMGLNRQLSLGVQNASPNAPGSYIYTANANQSESAVLGAPQLSRQGNPNYIELDANGDGGASYVDTANPLLDAHTTNFEDYIENPASAPFLTSSLASVTPSFNAYGDTDLVLLSPFMSLQPGQSTSYTFYYQFSPTEVPEPDALSMLMGGSVVMGSIVLRMRRKSRAA